MTRYTPSTSIGLGAFRMDKCSSRTAFMVSDELASQDSFMASSLEKKQSLGTLADEVKIFPQLLKNVRVKDKRTALDNEAVQKAIEQTAEELGSDGRILVRESGTEPVIRVMVEAASDEICEKYVDGVVKIFEQEGLCE